MVSNPDKYIDDYATLNTEYITIHTEILGDIEKYLRKIKDYGIKCGLSLKPDTPVKEIIPYLPLLDLVLVMSVEPGMGGQEFIKESETKINELRDLITEYNSSAKISVDGGIKLNTKEYCKNCDIVVSGSYIINSEDFEERINSLR